VDEVVATEIIQILEVVEVSEEEVVSTTTEAVSEAIGTVDIVEDQMEAEEVTEEETETKEILRTENFVKATEA
jgi:hypothetical protein